MKKILNISVVFASILLMALSCDPEDISFNVSKTMEDSFLVEVTESESETISVDKLGLINLAESDEFQEYKDNMEVESINKMYVSIEPAEGESAVIGTANITRAALAFMKSDANYNVIDGTYVEKWLVHSASGVGAEYSTLEKFALAGKIDVLSLFTQSDIDNIIDIINNGETVTYAVIFDMEGAAPIKFNVAYEYDVTAKVSN